MESKSNKREERTLKTYLTYQELRVMKACEEALFSFRSIFGKKATIKQVVYRLQNPGKRDKYVEDYGSWLGWLMAETLVLTTALLKAGVDVHTHNDYAFRWAVERGHTEIVKILLKAGADVHTNNDEVLCLAIGGGHTEIVKILLKTGVNVHADNDYALRLAATYGHTEIVKILKAAMKKK